MGKIQKIKEQRKLEREEMLQRRKERKKKALKLSIIFIALCVIAGGGLAVWKTLWKETPPEEPVVAKEKIAVLETNLGVIKFKFFAEAAPKTVENFEKLAGEGFYDGIKFHRVIKDFMIQTGDPNSKDDDWLDDGLGGPGYAFEDEINDYKLIRGRVAMANSGPNTNGSQFFILITGSTPWLDGEHTVFGEVIEGMDVADQIESVETNENNHPMEDVIMAKVYIEEI